MTKTLATVCVVCGLVLCACTAPKKARNTLTNVTVSTAEPTTTTTTTAPAPVPSTPDTAAPVISTAAPSTTLPEPEPTTEPPAPPADTTVSLDDPDMPKWREIALCEMPGPGGVPSEPWGAHWTFKASKFSGALGVFNGTWLAAGGGKYGPTAGDATWQQQIEIARVIRDRWGYGAWGCG